MAISDRDAQVLEKIVKYCEEIEHAHREYHCDYETFCNNPTYRNAVALCLMQIGELTNKLSVEFRDTYTQIPWRAIRGMRNVVAHEYGQNRCRDCLGDCRKRHTRSKTFLSAVHGPRYLI